MFPVARYRFVSPTLLFAAAVFTAPPATAVEAPRDAIISITTGGIWNRDAVDTLLGPAFDLLNPNANDDRPTLFKQSSKAGTCGFSNRINPFELGDRCFPDNDYWSESGQVIYVPDDPAKDPGIDRIQVYAYYDHVFALSPRLDYASGTPHPDPQTTEQTYAQQLGHAPRQPIAMVRNYGMLQNEALVIYQGGLLAVAGTQTSREGWERPYPGLMLPANKKPTAIAVTAETEFALIAVTDTDTGKGQLAVVALEGKYLPFHTWPYMAMAHQGSFSDFKLLGFVDLPMSTPTSVAASSNGFWGGPSQTGGQVLSQINLADDGTRQGCYNGEQGWQAIVATKGYAIVASRTDNVVAVVDLTPLFSYIRESYLSSADSYNRTLQARGPGPNDFPQTFNVRPAATPTVSARYDVDKPTAVLAGLVIDRWSLDRYKAYAASEDGTIRIFDTSSLMARWEWEKNGPLKEIGSFKVGRNPTSMAFTRHGDYPVPLIPNGHDGTPMRPDPLNNTFYVACRGDREVVAVSTWEGQGQVYRRIKDSRMGDPVGVSVAYRGNIVSVADFRGRKVLSFRIGGVYGRHGEYYGSGEDGKADHEFAGELPVAGHPFMISSSNVN